MAEYAYTRASPVTAPVPTEPGELPELDLWMVRINRSSTPRPRIPHSGAPNEPEVWCPVDLQLRASILQGYM